MTEDEMVGWHHGLDGHEFEQAPGDGDGQEAWRAAVQESDTTERLNGTEYSVLGASLVAHLVKNPPAMWETWV